MLDEDKKAFTIVGLVMIVVLVITLLFNIGCGESAADAQFNNATFGQSRISSAEQVAKKCVEKYIDGHVCYIVADDGTYLCTTDKEAFFKGRVDDMITSAYWRGK